MDLFELDLRAFGASGFSLRDRLDITGHGSGKVDPHINSELVKPDEEALRKTWSPKFGRVDYRDLSNNQLPGFNGMQNQLVTPSPRSS